MMKHKKILLLTSVMLLLPIVVGVFLWGQLPEKMPTHWGFNGQIDGVVRQSVCRLWNTDSFACVPLDYCRSCLFGRTKP